MKQDIAVSSGPSAPAPAHSARTQAATPGAAAASHSDVARSRERLVTAMMALVTVAFATGLYLQFGIPAATAVLAGAGLWVLLVALQSTTAKGEQVDKLKGEVQRLEGEVAQLKSGLAGHRGPLNAQAASQHGPQLRIPDQGSTIATAKSPNASESSGSAARPSEPVEHAAAAAAHHKLEPDPRWEQPKTPPKSRLVKPESASGASPPVPPTRSEPRLIEAAIVSAPAAPVLRPVPPSPSPDPLRDAWSFRPKDAGAIELEREITPEVEQRIRQPAKPVITIDRELEMVQRKIKALAEEVNAAEASRAMTGSADPSPLLPGALDQSVGALKAASQSMRERAPDAPPPQSSLPQSRQLPSADFFIPATAERIAISSPEPETNDRERDYLEPPQIAPEIAPARLPQAQYRPLPAASPVPPPPPPVPAPDARIAAIASAIHAGNMDVYFSPIVALQDQAVRHFEVIVRLKTPAGSNIDNVDDVIELAGSDLAGLFDGARLARSAAFAARLDALQKPGSVLSPVTGRSITDGHFLETFAHHYEERQTISTQLVLTFSQADVARLSTSAWQALGDMHAFGFRFAIDRVHHLDMDFELLAQRGFGFVKLPARAFVEGLPLADGTVPASDICRHLAGLRLTLVADTIEDEALRARVFGFGVLFGQGQLFGGARPINLDTTARTAAA